MRISLHGALRTPSVLATALGASPVEPSWDTVEIGGIATDSREVEAGDLFAVLEGEHVHGRTFIKEAAKRGALAVLDTEFSETLPSKVIPFLVPQVLAALAKAATYRRERMRTRVIAISGSVGKTTLKEVLSALLSVRFSVAKSEGNFNSGLGMPLSLLGMEEREVTVLELGISHAGEMAPLSAAAAPHVAVLTNVGEAHLANFSSKEALLREKLQIAAGMKKGGCLFLPEEIRLPSGSVPPVSILRYGCSPRSFAYGEKLSMGKEGLLADIAVGGREITNITWPIAGKPGLSQLLPAVAVAVHFGLTDEEIKEGLQRAAVALPRMKEIRIGTVTLIDDTYNASPLSVRAAAEHLRWRGKEGKTVLVLGDMLELAEPAAAHRALGTFVAGMGIDELFCYGALSLSTANGAILAGMSPLQVHYFPFGEEAALSNALLFLAKGKVTFLFKASRRLAMEQILQSVRSRCYEC